MYSKYWDVIRQICPLKLSLKCANTGQCHTYVCIHVHTVMQFVLGDYFSWWDWPARTFVSINRPARTINWWVLCPSYYICTYICLQSPKSLHTCMHVHVLFSWPYFVHMHTYLECSRPSLLSTKREETSTCRLKILQINIGLVQNESWQNWDGFTHNAIMYTTHTNSQPK